jgi:hypothetical protein
MDIMRGRLLSTPQSNRGRDEQDNEASAGSAHERKQMRVRLFIAAVTIVLGVMGTGVASAASVQNITPYMCPTSTGGFNNSGNPVVSAAESGGLPVQLSFGWGARQTNQLDKFLSVQNGSVTLTDPSGNVVFSDVWAVGDSTGWRPYTQTMLTPNGTTFVQGWPTKKHELFGSLSNPVAGK